MADAPGPEMWATLRSQRPLSDGSVVTQPVSWEGQETSLLAGVSAENELHLMIPLADDQARRVIADLNGLKVRLRVTDIGPYLDLVASPQHERVFSPVCREVIEAVHAQGREPWAAADTVIRHWQSAWRATRPQMSQAVQIGLVGELIVLSRVMIPLLGARAVLMWSGADSERHDFIAGALHLEVKTTKGIRHEHDISRLDQLWSEEGQTLLLASIRLEATIGGALSVATLIDEIIEHLRHEPVLVDEFQRKLLRLDWAEEMRRSGELLLFNLQDAAFHEVDADFPRLAEDFRRPSGVIAVRYTISLANLPALSLDEVNEMLTAAAAAE
ncbi:PD-(D/E)XK motif protein [Mesorhizobium sp. B4-1-3]|uniref:PD-(D/E)XK motif protein n=1 Tax=Mesorhizobium sp. B4-1-3 TaxID=2589889 RepID=UPI00112E8DF5|nr:PD-(D/E)XK motif protein [Mesorhizobium sp. B4-1-3]TPI09916.1 PD-(D/E)XK motif protein [Mesorhizobium sp. B4-1-3]